MTNNNPIPESLEELRKCLNDAWSVCSDRSPRWRAVILKIEEAFKRIDLVQPLIAKLEEQIKRLEIECGEWIQKEYHANSQLAKLEAENKELKDEIGVWKCESCKVHGNNETFPYPCLKDTCEKYGNP